MQRSCYTYLMKLIDIPIKKRKITVTKPPTAVKKEDSVSYFYLISIT